MDKDKKRVLSIGAKKSMLTRFSEKLKQQGFLAWWTNRFDTVLEEFNGNDFDVIAFGRGVNSKNRQLFKAEFKKQNPQIQFVDGLAPIPNLLIDQIRLATLPAPKVESIGHIEFVGVKQLQLTILKSCKLVITHYHLNFLFQSDQHTIFSEQVSPGILTIPFRKKIGRNFMVIGVDEQVNQILSL